MIEIKVYAEGEKIVKSLSEINYKVLKRLLARMLDARNSCYAMCVYLYGEEKKQICEELGFENTCRLDTALATFCKKNILKRVERGMYQFNPFMFGKGEWRYIARLRLIWNFNDIVRQSKQCT